MATILHDLWLVLTASALARAAAIALGLYTWAGAWFLFLRFYRAETESRMRNFLKAACRVYLLRSRQDGARPVTKEAIRKGNWTGWPFATMVLVGGLGAHASFWNLAAGLTMLAMGGFAFAFGWYGLRCLRLLGLESFRKEDGSR